MTFVTDNEKFYDKYNEIWEVIKKLLKVKFAANPVRDDKYLMMIIIKIIFVQKEVIIFVFQQ